MEKWIEERIKNIIKNKEQICDLRKLRLSEFPKLILKNSFLKELNLSHDCIINENNCGLDEEYWWEVSFDNNIIPIIPSEISQADNLEKLLLDQVNLDLINNNISKLTNLKYLTLKNNNLFELPENFGNLKNLEYLDLSMNNLSTLPESFKNLKNIKYLNLGNNLFTKIPPEIFSLKKLEELYFNNLFIRFYETAERFSIHDNSINEIPSDFKKLQNLKIADFSNNKIINISSNFYEDEKVIKLTNNPITTIARFKDYKIFPGCDIYNYSIIEDHIFEIPPIQKNEEDEYLVTNYNLKQQALFNLKDLYKIQNKILNIIQNYNDSIINDQFIYGYKYYENDASEYLLYQENENYFFVFSDNKNKFIQKIFKFLENDETFLSSFFPHRSTAITKQLNVQEISQYYKQEVMAFGYKIEENIIYIAIPVKYYENQFSYNKYYKKSKIHFNTINSLQKQNNYVLSFILDSINLLDEDITNFLNYKTITIKDYKQPDSIFYNHTDNQIIGYGDLITIENIASMFVNDFYDTKDLNDLEMTHKLKNNNCTLYFALFETSKQLTSIKKYSYFMSNKNALIHPFVISIKNKSLYKAIIKKNKNEDLIIKRIN